MLSETAIIKLSHLGSQQPHFLVLGHCAEPALGDTPGIPTEYEGNTQPRKVGEVFCSRGRDAVCFLFLINRNLERQNGKVGGQNLGERE